MPKPSLPDSIQLSFAKAMDQFPFSASSPKLAIALSGGSDSMALTLLAQGWAKTNGPEVSCLTVDHHIRPESGDEATYLHEWCKMRGIEHHTLNWQPPATPTQALAREARYQLLTNWCKANQVIYLMTGHQREDQAETLFFRLARGSGLDGLACMAPYVTLAENIRLLRPLLSFSKSQLIDFLHARGERWLEDPSNQKPTYTRNRMRAAISASENADALCLRAYRVTESLGRFRTLLEKKFAQELASHVQFSEGEALIDAPAFFALEPEYGLRILAHIVRSLGGHEHRPRTEKLERLYAEIMRPERTHATSLGGCIFSLPVNNRIAVRCSPRTFLPPSP